MRYILKELIKIKNGKDYKMCKSGSIPVYGTGGIINYIGEFLYNDESILLPRKGSLSNIIYVNQPFWTVDTMYWTYVNKEIVLPKYLYFYLKLLDLSSRDSGSTLPSMTFDAYYELEVEILSIKEQKKILDLLNPIEEKIMINTKINDNLEQQAKLLYNYWFTQFDFPDENGKPYRTSGGKMVWNEQLKQDIPEGWEVKSLTEILQKNTDVFDYQSIQPAVDLSIMPSNSITISQLNSSNSFTTNLFTMKKGDILFGSIRPYLHKAGFAPCDGVVAGTVHSFRVKNSQDNNFALMTVSRDNFFNYAVNVSSGTKMPVVSSDSILDYKVPYNNKIARRYNEIPLIAIISSHIQENQKLISLRDWLLPMLMNGQATIED